MQADLAAGGCGNDSPGAATRAGYSYQRTRTWVRTGYALRKRKSGTVTTYDSQTPEKKVN